MTLNSTSAKYLELNKIVCTKHGRVDVRTGHFDFGVQMLLLLAYAMDTSPGTFPWRSSFVSWPGS